MTAVPRECSPRRRRSARSALLALLVALASLGSLAFAPAAGAGQIVWSTGTGIWAMNDDGSDPHELIAASSSQLAATLPSGTLTQPDVFQNGGTAVLFLGLTGHFAPASLPAACGADCSGTYELSGGVLRELAPAAAAASGAAYYERQPRVTADGQELFDSTLYTGIGTGAAGTPATALVERPLALDATITQWSSTDSELEPAAGFDGAPDPADPTLAAWVQAQGCGFSVTNAQGVSQSSCQYAVHFGSAADAAAPIATYDNELVSANGTGPTSLALSTDGTTLLLVDPYAPDEGIFTTPVAGMPGVKPVTEIVAQPAGWTFGQARFAGANIVFDAHQQLNGKTTGDIYSIAASCGTVNTCTFPASATDLTKNPLVDNSDPAWTSATAPLAPLHVAVVPRINSVTPSTKIRSGRSFALVVRLSAPARIVVTIARPRPGSAKATTIASFDFSGRAGANRLVLTLAGKRALAPGSYSATVSLGGSSAQSKTLHLTVGR
jgi:hypothetical protein